MTQIIPYSDNYQIASEHLRQVLPFLAKHEIPASPLNYQIAYDYISGSNPLLNQALDKILENSSKLTQQQFFELYKQFVIQDHAALESIRQELQNIIGNVQGEYDNSSTELSDYLDSLNGFNRFLGAANTESELAAETDKVIQTTQSTEQSQRQFETQMSGMMGEMEALRKQLEKVKEESLTDALTGLSNRKAFDQALELVKQKYAQQAKPFSLVIGDIDHFKKFNDSFGHLVGDKVLKFVGKTIKSCVKGKDMAARFGGEEFVVLLPDTNHAGAKAVAENIRKAISRNNLKDHRKNESYGKITISLGVAQFKGSETTQDLLNRADKALYQAKESGRNRVEIAR